MKNITSELGASLASLVKAGLLKVVVDENTFDVSIIRALESEN